MPTSARSSRSGPWPPASGSTAGRCGRRWPAPSPPRGKCRTAAPALDPWKETIEGWLKDDETAPRKQRHTARRVWQRLVDEYGAEVSESSVRRHVAMVRRQRGVAIADVCVPQHHPLAEEAEVDFGQVTVWIDGTETELWMFVMRMSASGKGFHRVYANQAQEVFLDGHVQAFEYFGGIPGRIRYDNLKPAVSRVLKGRDREETERFIALRSHYGFDSFFCIPGKEGAHEKGGVEGEVGRFRRRHMVPAPKVGSILDVNVICARGDIMDDHRHVAGRLRTVADVFADERPLLRPVPDDPFDTARPARAAGWTRRAGSAFDSASTRFLPTWPAGGSRCAWERHRSRPWTAPKWSPATLGRSARASRCWNSTTTSRSCSTSRGRWPGHRPLPPPERQRLSGQPMSGSGPRHGGNWGTGAGTRALIEVLLLCRHLPAEALSSGLEAALAVGSVDPDVVCVEARHMGETPVAPVVPITRLAQYDRPEPSVAQYDELLGRESS